MTNPPSRTVHEPAYYNPLAEEELRAAVLFKLTSTTALPLADLNALITSKFGGIYALYYRGDHPAYRLISRANPTHALYVGQSARHVLGRLRKHKGSIEQTELSLDHFLFRVLRINPSFVSLGEQAAIRAGTPWNGRGLGGNTPGVNREDQTRSEWDTLHPGRYPHLQRPHRKAPDTIIADIQAELQARIADHLNS